MHLENVSYLRYEIKHKERLALDFNPFMEKEDFNNTQSFHSGHRLSLDSSYDLHNNKYVIFVPLQL